MRARRLAGGAGTPAVQITSDTQRSRGNPSLEERRFCFRVDSSVSVDASVTLAVDDDHSSVL
jgi:hypothetical protein